MYIGMHLLIIRYQPHVAICRNHLYALNNVAVAWHLNQVPITNQTPPTLNKLLLHSCCEALAHHYAQLGIRCGGFFGMFSIIRGGSAAKFLSIIMYI
jgi:hypothetical protein